MSFGNLIHEWSYMNSHNKRPIFRYAALISSVVMMLAFSGCSPLSKGWSAYEKNDFDTANTEWGKSEKPELTKRIAAVKRMIKFDQKAKNSKKRRTKVQAYINILSQDKWAEEKWAQKSPTIKNILEEAHKAVELERPRLQKQYDASVECGKKFYMEDEYEQADKCFDSAHKATITYKGLTPRRTDFKEMASAVKQGIELRREMERERLAAIAKQKAYEEEQQRLLEEAKAAAAQLQAEAEREAELQRIREEEARQLAEAKKKKRWMAFLAKGKPLKPLIAVVGVASKGKGRNMKKGDVVKWQGSAKFPSFKKKKLRAEDLYALEIVVPASYKANYLRNYSKSGGNLLKMPSSSKGKKHYYTEGYKGGRFYTEVKNLKGKNSKYKIKATIYKQAVIH